MSVAAPLAKEPEVYTFKHWSEVPDSKADWKQIAREGNYRKRLHFTTQMVLKVIACSAAPFTELNQIGLYHELPVKFARPMLEEFEKFQKAPDTWASKGEYPGIWCSLFDSRNTVSRHHPTTIFRFTFKADYKIFNLKNPDHLKMWETWKAAEANLNKKNAWKDALSAGGIPLDQRMHGYTHPIMAEFLHRPEYDTMPDHVEFYRDNNFSACLGYSDYMALVVVLPESIASVKQVEE